METKPYLSSLVVFGCASRKPPFENGLSKWVVGKGGRLSEAAIAALIPARKTIAP